jgi:hypothetical protein
MTLFPFSRPQVGLYISADSLCVAHMNRRMGRTSFGGYVEQPLPSGSIRLSPVGTNILEDAQVIACLQALFGNPKGPQSVALCLPDLCARTTIIELADFPSKAIEQRALVEWRLQQDLNLPKEPMRISYQILSSSTRELTNSSDQPIQLLATAIQESIIEKYESVCLEVGLIPASIHLASLAVLNMCQPILASALHTTTDNTSFVSDTQLFLYLADWGFSIIGMRNQVPFFLRIKPLPHMSLWNSQASPSVTPPNDQNQEDGDPTNEEGGFSVKTQSEPAFTPQTANLITNELVGTLQYLFESHETLLHTDNVYPLFLIGSHAPESVLPLITERIQKEFPYESDPGTPRIKAIPLFPGNAALNLKPLSGLPAWTNTSLPAYAATSQLS